MKTLDELKQMNFIPHHECGCCGEIVGWNIRDGQPLFNPSCDCGCSIGHFDTWENVFKWYNTAFEHESEEEVDAEWERCQSPENAADAELKTVKLHEMNEIKLGLRDDKLYFKSEADKVIAELKQKLNEAQTELELWRDGSIISEAHQKELDEKRHSDYKRCLAMAKCCAADCVVNQDTYKRFLTRKSEFRIGHFRKWYNRWLKLAEKFRMEHVSCG